MNNFRDWLNQKFFEWRRSIENERAPIGDFAQFLGFKYSVLSHWMNGLSTPSRGNVGKIAEKLGPEVYDILGFARPGTAGSDLSVPPGFSPNVLQKIQILFAEMEEMTEEERLTALDEAVQYRMRRKHARLASAKRGKRA